jgi:hypothetical protein
MSSVGQGNKNDYHQKREKTIEHATSRKRDKKRHLQSRERRHTKTSCQRMDGVTGDGVLPNLTQSKKTALLKALF